MATKVTSRFFVQTTAQLHRQFGAWVGAMKGTEVCLGRETCTKDALGNALFLWARRQKPEELARMLEPYLDEFDKIWASRDEVSEKPPAGVVATQVNANSKRKASG